MLSKALPSNDQGAKLIGISFRTCDTEEKTVERLRQECAEL